MATIKDVAKKAGVAISTVSAVINRSAPVSDAMVERVERAIKETKFLPHGAARSLRSGQSRLIGLVVPDITSSHFARVAGVVENVCFDAGYMSFVYSTNEDATREVRILRMLRMQRVAGLIHIPTRSDPAHGQSLASNIDVPTVLLDSQLDGIGYDSVTLDNGRAAQLAVEHLFEFGHRDIAVVAGRAGVTTGDERLAGTRLAFEKAGVPWREDRVIMAEFLQEIARHRILEMMRTGAPPTAIVAHSGHMMIGVLEALRELDLAWPQAVSLVGIDDFEGAQLIRPSITVVSQPIADMAASAIGTLLREVAKGGPAAGTRTNFPPRLIVRESCARWRGDTAN